MSKRIAGPEIERLIQLLMYIACFAALIMMTHVVADVFSRAVLGGSLPGTTLLVTEYYMVACAFLPLAYTHLKSAHVTMDAISDMLPPKWQRFQLAVGQLVTAIVFAVLTYSAWLTAVKKTALGTFDMESGIRLYLWPALWLLPLGCGVLCLFAIMRLVQYATGTLPEPETPRPEDI